MSKKTNGVNYGKTIQQQSRRRRALDMLENQLKEGFKPSKLKENRGKPTPLTEKDIKRINKEISILKERV